MKVTRILIVLPAVAILTLLLHHAWNPGKDESTVAGAGSADFSAEGTRHSGASDADASPNGNGAERNRDEMAQLAVSKREPARPVEEGADFDYTLTVTNSGPAPAVNVVVSESLSPEVAFVRAAGAGWNCELIERTPTCTRPSLAVGTAPLITITVTALFDDAGLAYDVNVTADNAYPAAAKVARPEPHTAPPIVHKVIKNMLLKPN